MFPNGTCLWRRGDSTIAYGNRNVRTACPRHPGHCESTEGLWPISDAHQLPGVGLQRRIRCTYCYRNIMQQLSKYVAFLNIYYRMNVPNTVCGMYFPVQHHSLWFIEYDVVMNKILPDTFYFIFYLILSSRMDSNKCLAKNKVLHS